MKASLRLTLIIIAVISFFFLVIAVFLPGDITVEASTEITASPEVVFNEVNVLKNWEYWSPFEDDSTMINNYEGPDSGVGAKRIWTSKHMGSGNMIITRSIPYRFIDTKLIFGAPGTAEGRWTFTGKQGKTQVRWQLHILKLRYPFGKWLGLIMNKMMKPVLKKGLRNLKITAEKQKVGSTPSPRTP